MSLRIISALAVLATAAAAGLQKDPVHIANVLSGNYHIAYVPESDMILSKAGLGPGATGIDMPCAAPCNGEAAEKTNVRFATKLNGMSKEKFEDAGTQNKFISVLADKLGVKTDNVKITDVTDVKEAGAKAVEVKKEADLARFKAVSGASGGAVDVKVQITDLELNQANQVKEGITKTLADPSEGGMVGALKKAGVAVTSADITDAPMLDNAKRSEAYTDAKGSECNMLSAMEFESTPADSKGAHSDSALGANRGSNALHFNSDGWTNTTTCDMTAGCTTKMEQKVRSFHVEAPAQTEIIRFAINYGEEDGGDTCDRRRDERMKAYLKSVKEEETYKVKKAEEDEKEAMSKCAKGTQFNKQEKACEACADGKFNDKKGGLPCKDRISKCPAGDFLETKDKDTTEDFECNPCGDEEFSAAEDDAKTCTDWKAGCPVGEGWARGENKKDATCTVCAKGTFKNTKDGEACEKFTFSKDADCKAGFRVALGDAKADSKCVPCAKDMFRADGQDECKAFKTTCPMGEELKGGSKSADKQCMSCTDGRFKAEESGKECKLSQVCDGTGEKTKKAGDAKTNTVCECSDGFKTLKAKDGNGIDCEPVNMCTSGKHDCHDNAKCSYRGPGKFDCKCKKTFFGDGKKCDAHKTTCPKGEELKGGSSLEDKTCANCPAGKFKDAADGKECKDFLAKCPKGEELTGGERTEDKKCAACKKTHWKDDDSGDACDRRLADCPMGQEIKEGGSAFADNTCVACAENTFKSSAGSAKCKAMTKECGEGLRLVKGTAKADAKCAACANGRFKAGTNGDAVCKPFTPGCANGGEQWKKGTRAADRTCPPCPEGEWIDAASAKKGEKCKAFIDSCAAGFSMTAPKGKADKTVNRVCTACARGSFRSGVASGAGVLEKKCAPHFVGESQCPSPDPKVKFFNLKCNAGGADPNCATQQLTCTPDAARNGVVAAEAKCESACGIGKDTSGGKKGWSFDSAAWVKDLKAGTKLSPEKDVFKSSQSITDTENKYGFYCSCQCKGEQNPNIGANQRFYFDIFASTPGCRLAQREKTCASVGDPHPTTFNNFRYNYYQYGEYSFQYRQDMKSETRLFAGLLHSHISAGIASALRSENEICSVAYGKLRCSTSFTNDKEYAAFEKDDNRWKDKNQVRQMYMNGKRNCGGNLWGSRRKNPSNGSPIKIVPYGNGVQMTSGDNTVLKSNFWRSNCVKGRGHSPHRGPRGEGGGGCGSRYYANSYVVQRYIPAGVDGNRMKQYGICGTPDLGTQSDRVNTGIINGATNSNRNDPPRNTFFRKVKFPGVAMYARAQSGAKMDFRSYFWCNGDDNGFVNKDYESAEHPANGQRYWSFLEKQDAEKQGAGKFSRLRALTNFVQEAPMHQTKETVAAEDKKEAEKKADAARATVTAPISADKPGEKEVEDTTDPAEDEKENEERVKKEPVTVKEKDTGMTQEEAEKACAEAKPPIKQLNKHGEKSEAWENCISDVKESGDKKGMTEIAAEEEKDDESTEDEKEADEKEGVVQDKKAQKEAVKERGNPLAPFVEVCPMTAGSDCSKDSSFTEVVALPAATFDKKEWNRIKVVLPVKKGERVQVRFRQSKTTCECCDDWAIDSLQFLMGAKCAPGAVNE